MAHTHVDTYLIGLAVIGAALMATCASNDSNFVQLATSTSGSSTAAVSSTTGSGGAGGGGGGGATSTSSSSSSGTGGAGGAGGGGCIANFFPVDLGALDMKQGRALVASDCNGIYVATNAPGVDALITKYGFSGKVAASTSLKGAGDQAVAAIALDAGGGLWVAANLTGQTMLGACPAIGAFGPPQIGIIHYDSSFKCLQAQAFDKGVVTAIAADATGAIVAGGGKDGFSLGWVQADAGNMAFAGHLTPMGQGFNTDWLHTDRTNDLNSVITATAIAQTSVNGGHIAIAGYARGTTLLIGPSQAQSPSGGLSDDGFFVTLNPQTGNAQTAEWFGGTGANSDTHVNGIAFDAAGGVIAVGRAPKSFNFFNLVPPINGASDAFALEYDNQGTPKWAQFAGADGADEATAVAVTPQGVIISGTYNGKGETQAMGCSQTVNGPNTAFVLTLDGSGKCLHNQVFPDAAGSFGQAFAINDKNALLTGAFFGTIQLPNKMLQAKMPPDGFLSVVDRP